MDVKYQLRRAGIIDRLREKGRYASYAAAIAEEKIRALPEREFLRVCHEEDLKFFVELERMAETDETRELAASWKREMQRRLDAMRGGL
jgi:hypothetical protein